jgi:hypothetical protein
MRSRPRLVGYSPDGWSMGGPRDEMAGPSTHTGFFSSRRAAYRQTAFTGMGSKREAGEKSAESRLTVPESLEAALPYQPSNKEIHQCPKKSTVSAAASWALRA